MLKKIMRQGQVSAVVLLLAATLAGPARANLLQNGGFEADSFSGQYQTGIPTGWQSLGNGSTVDILVGGYGGGMAAEGSRYVDLIGGGIGSFPSGLRQTVHLLAGQTYRLSFDYNGGRYTDGSATVGAVLEYSLGALLAGSVNVDGLNNFPDYYPVTSPWQHFAADVQATSSGDYELRFQTPSGAWGSPYVDNVVLEGNPVGEPGQLALLFGGLALLARRRRRAVPIRR